MFPREDIDDTLEGLRRLGATVVDEVVDYVHLCGAQLTSVKLCQEIGLVLAENSGLFQEPRPS